jgi:polysaccharide export outer membrane protein
MTIMVPLIGAILVGACGVTPTNDGGAPGLQANIAVAQPNAGKGKEAPNSVDMTSEGDVVRNVAFSLTSVADPASKTYKIGPRDVLDITVFKVSDLSKTVRVSETGTFTYPLIGELQAAGKTAREIEKELVQSLGARYLQNPQITVLVKEFNSQRVTVEGAVKKPGVYPIPGGLSLLQALAEAQGLEETADRTVLLFRQSNGRRLAGKYDVSAIRNGDAEDPQLEGGDVVIVPTSGLREGFNYLVKLLPLAAMAPYL